MLAMFYAEFNKFSEVKKIFPITTDVKEMQEWNTASRAFKVSIKCDGQFYYQVT